MPMLRPTIESLLACPNLPTLPVVAMQVLELTRADDVAVQDIERVVQLDPALTARILKTVNSSYYGLSKPCPTIGRALTYLGLNTVKSLILGFSLVDVTRHAGGLDLVAYWQRSIFGAVAARRLATRLATCDPEEAFVAGLMQDIGLLALDRAHPEAYAPLLQACDGRHGDLPAAEREALGFDHAAAGAALAERWRLPGPIVDAIRWHHRAGDPHLPAAPSVAITAFACLLFEAMAATEGRAAEPTARLRGLAGAFNLGGEELAQLADAARDDARQISSKFKVNLGQLPAPGALLAQAEEAMVAHQISMQRRAEDLSRQARTDGLTGVGNRKSFDEDLASNFEQARRMGGSLGLIMTDVDRFKSFNDTHGHPAGDAVLVELARRLATATADRGQTYRYGGEEFVVLLPGATVQATAQAAEELRRLIEQQPMAILNNAGAPQRVPVTSSFGAAVLDPSSRTMLSTPALLVQAADRALYAAKHSGRNCVRLFRPRAGQEAA
jgi:diguanylate cyclase (GGDEF)-like protein